MTGNDSSVGGTNQCEWEDCDGEAKWRWWNGMGAFGPYCDDCAREQLADENRCPITRQEDVSDGYVLPAGIQPDDQHFPTIRTKSAFDTYLETDGEEPRQCDVGWCSKIATECGHDGENPLVTDGGRPGVAVEQLEDCLRQAERDWEDALKSGDTQGASYAFGKRSAFITAIEVLQEDSQP